MVAFTSPIGLPYPETTDRVADGWDAIRDLAEATDDAIVADRASLALKATTAALTTETNNRVAGDNALDARLDTIEADTGWIAASLATGWAAYGGSYPAPAYRKRAGLVHLRGLAKASGFPEHAIQIFTLPVGYRPGAIGIFVGAGRLYTPDVGDVGVRIDITSAGLVQPTLEATDTSGAVGFVALDGICFPADA